MRPSLADIGSPNPRRYVFAEFVPVRQLVSREVLSLLSRAELTLYAAVTPANVDEAELLVRACRDAGVSVGLWPMVDDSQGRWASQWNAREFADFGRRLLGSLAEAGAAPNEIVLDLEPPIDLTKRLLRGRGGRGLLASRTTPEPLVDWVNGVSSVAPVVATVAPWIVGRPRWQRILGTPVDALELSRVFAMSYTSLFEGYSRRLLSRTHAEALLGAWASAANERLGDRCGIAVGVVGVGALGDEQIYRDPSELARDVGICLASGCRHLALFNLRGVLSRPRPLEWLEAFASTEIIEPPPPSKRVRAILAAISAVEIGAKSPK